MTKLVRRTRRELRETQDLMKVRMTISSHHRGIRNMASAHIGALQQKALLNEVKFY